MNSTQESLDDSILSIFAVLPLNGDECSSMGGVIKTYNE